jgi:hypothetical protein
MAKQRANKVPKRIAGVKVPKAIRKGPVGDFLSSSGGQVLLAELLLALGAVYAARRLDGGDALRQSRNRLRAGRDWSRDTSERIAHAIRAGVQAFRAALHEPLDGAAAGAAAAELGETPAEGGATRKKPSSRREQPPRDAPSTPH